MRMLKQPKTVVFNFVDILTDFSTCLVAYRTRHGLTQKQLAEQLGVSQPMISKYEQGTNNISVGTLNHICYALGISLSVKMELGKRGDVSVGCNSRALAAGC